MVIVAIVLQWNGFLEKIVSFVVVVVVVVAVCRKGNSREDGNIRNDDNDQCQEEEEKLCERKMTAFTSSSSFYFDLTLKKNKINFTRLEVELYTFARLTEVANLASSIS